MKKFVRKTTVILVLCVIFTNLCACSLTEKYFDKKNTVHATVIEIEQYGHAVLDVTTADFCETGYALGDIVSVRFESYESDMPFFDGYYSDPGEVMLRGSAPEKNIAICINYGDFSDETGIAIGQKVEITMAEKAGMLALQELCALKYSNNRADFPDDVTFANFRAVKMGHIGEGKLYRTASPINNKIDRARYANDLIAAVEVATVLNLSDSMDEIEEYCKAEDFESTYYRTLFEEGKIMAFKLNAIFASEQFATSIAEGFQFLARNNPPYCVHCTEGKDRTGFAVMLLEGLMGAELEEIIEDYMLSFSNYYGIDKEKEPERYDVVLETNLLAMLYHVTGTDTYEELVQVDLEESVTKYLIQAGMEEADIAALKEKLRGN